jgi:hypothetical protein
MEINVNPKLNANVEFWDILELFEKYGYCQFEGSNFHLMLEICFLIGFKEEKDRKYSEFLLENIRSKLLKSK